MDAPDGHRRNGSLSTNRTGKQQTHPNYQPYRETQERSPQDHPAMATATLLHPTSSFPPPQPYSYPHHNPSMISPTESRNEDSDSSKRQSLPSISEVISGAKQPYAPQQSNVQPSPSSFSPFSSNSRSYSEPEKHAPPPQAPLPPPPGSYSASRQEPLPPFSGSPRLPYNGRPGLPPVSDRRTSPPIKSELPHHMQDQPKDHRPLNGYPHPSHSAGPPPPPSYSSTPLPPGQLHLPSYPVSPRHAPPHVYGHYDQRPPPVGMEDGRHHHSEFNRVFETGNYHDSLSRMAQASRTMFTFADAYSRIAQEQHGPHHIPERLPTEQEVNDMIANAELIRNSLEFVRDVVQQSIRSERAREGNKPKAPMHYDDEEDVHMYGEGMKTQYTITEVKKRRGRAAPPGRCHSCNRVDTPEWRRGPDGARTLCNACGLHYAKLERKRQLEQRSIRPKPDERSRESSGGNGPDGKNGPYI
ncbi:hypothetical protein V2G26_003445 [Clonostachys chloroleuca]